MQDVAKNLDRPGVFFIDLEKPTKMVGCDDSGVDLNSKTPDHSIRIQLLLGR